MTEFHSNRRLVVERCTLSFEHSRVTSTARVASRDGSRGERVNTRQLFPPHFARSLRHTAEQSFTHSLAHQLPQEGSPHSSALIFTPQGSEPPPRLLAFAFASALRGLPDPCALLRGGEPCQGCLCVRATRTSCTDTRTGLAVLRSERRPGAMTAHSTARVSG